MSKYTYRLMPLFSVENYLAKKFSTPDGYLPILVTDNSSIDGVGSSVKAVATYDNSIEGMVYNEENIILHKEIAGNFNTFNNINPYAALQSALYDNIYRFEKNGIPGFEFRLITQNGCASVVIGWDRQTENPNLSGVRQDYEYIYLVYGDGFGMAAANNHGYEFQGITSPAYGYRNNPNGVEVLEVDVNMNEFNTYKRTYGLANKVELVKYRLSETKTPNKGQTSVNYEIAQPCFTEEQYNKYIVEGFRQSGTSSVYPMIKSLVDYYGSVGIDTSAGVYYRGIRYYFLENNQPRVGTFSSDDLGRIFGVGNNKLNGDDWEESDMQDPDDDTGEKDKDGGNDDRSDDGNIPDPPMPNGDVIGNVYKVTSSTIRGLLNFLWNNDDFITTLIRQFGKVQDCIISLHRVFCPVTVGAITTIKLGVIDTGKSAFKVSNRYSEVDCGSITVDEYFKNAIDYSPYTRYRLYLPFIGVTNLDTNEITKATISVKYRFDCIGGTCVAWVRVKRTNMNAILYTFNGMISDQYPLSSGNFFSNMTGVVLGMSGVAGALAGYGGLAVGLGMAGTKQAIDGANINTINKIGGSHGAMLSYYPLLIIDRADNVNAKSYNYFQGIPANVTVRLSQVSGFTRVRKCRLNDIKCTDVERDKISAILKEGVII